MLDAGKTRADDQRKCEIRVGRRVGGPELEIELPRGGFLGFAESRANPDAGFTIAEADIRPDPGPGVRDEPEVGHGRGRRECEERGHVLDNACEEAAGLRTDALGARCIVADRIAGLVPKAEMNVDTAAQPLRRLAR